MLLFVLAPIVAVVAQDRDQRAQTAATPTIPTAWIRAGLYKGPYPAYTQVRLGQH